MSDKMREEFETWVVSRSYPVEKSAHYSGEYRLDSVQYSWTGYSQAWRHQQAVINTKDAEIAKLRADLERAKSDTKRLDFLTAFQNAWQCCWLRKGKGPVQWRMSEDGDWWGQKYLSAREAIDAAMTKKGTTCTPT